MSEEEEEKEEDMSALLMRSPERFAYTGEATRCRPAVPWELSLWNFISVLGWPCPIQRLRVLNHLYNGLQSSGPKTLTDEWPPPHLSSPFCHLGKNCVCACVCLRSALVCPHVFPFVRDVCSCLTWLTNLRRTDHELPNLTDAMKWYSRSNLSTISSVFSLWDDGNDSSNQKRVSYGNNGHLLIYKDVICVH